MKILKFEAEWCGPCHAMKPVVHKLAENKAIDMSAIDIDEHPEIAEQYQVRSIPTVVLLDDDGKEISRVVGAMPLPKLASALGLS
jgi:thioredoxin 1